jgi:hypothetical protein
MDGNWVSQSAAEMWMEGLRVFMGGLKGKQKKAGGEKAVCLAFLVSLRSGDGVFGDEGLLVEGGVAGGDDFSVGGGAGAEEEGRDEGEEQAFCFHIGWLQWVE